jgi:hypothetical protein
MSEQVTSLEFLRAVYQNNDLRLSVRMRAAKEMLPYEYPRLAVVAQVGDDSSFAERLERALARSAPKVIEAKAIANDHPEHLHRVGDSARLPARPHVHDGAPTLPRQNNARESKKSLH